MVSRVKIGFAVTCYDKFEELELLLSLLQRFKDEYPVGLCCNHPDGEKYRDKVDYYVQGREIPFVKGEGSEETFFFSQDDNYYIRLRAADSVRQSCELMTNESDCDYVIHVHADAWPLQEKGVKDLVQLLQDSGKVLAVRGRGLDTVYKPWTSTCAYGQADDHFFCFNRQFFKEHHVWEYKVEDMLLRRYSVHGLLMTLFAVKVGLGNLVYYRYLTECQDVMGQLSADGDLKPSLFDDQYCFLHVHRGSLPSGWGESVQSFYLQRYVDHPSEVIKRFIQQHPVDHVFHRIWNRNNHLDFWLRVLLFPRKTRLGYRVKHKELLLSHVSMKTVFLNIRERLFKMASSIFFPGRDQIGMYAKLNFHTSSWVDDWRRKT